MFPFLVHCTLIVCCYQITQLEEEIHKDWQIKCDKMLAVAAEKHNRALQAVTEEKQELTDSVQQLQHKVVYPYL